MLRLRGLIIYVVLWIVLLAAFIYLSETPIRVTNVLGLIILGLIPPCVLMSRAPAQNQAPNVVTLSTASVLALVAAVGILYLGASSSLTDVKRLWNPDEERRSPEPVPGELGPYVPTPYPVVEKMLELAEVTKNDVVYDLGCGDGRIVIAAAKLYGARGVGIELNPAVVKKARALVELEGVGDLVEIREGDALKVPDLEKATVLALYVLPEALRDKLLPQFETRLKRGTRVVSHNYDLAEWIPDKMTVVYADIPNVPMRLKHIVMRWDMKGPK